jgi:hypothetical protein
MELMAPAAALVHAREEPQGSQIGGSSGELVRARQDIGLIMVWAQRGGNVWQSMAATWLAGRRRSVRCDLCVCGAWRKEKGPGRRCGMAVPRRTDQRIKADLGVPA